MWPRRRLDAALIDAAVGIGRGGHVGGRSDAVIEGGRVVGVETDGQRIDGGDDRGRGVARRVRWRGCWAPIGLPTSRSAWRSAPTPPTPRHADAHLEACLSLRDEHGTPIPGYGWMFPAGDGTVNIGVGALSTMKGFKKLNLNTLLEAYRRTCRPTGISGRTSNGHGRGGCRCPHERRHGPGWVADRRRRWARQPDER